MGIRRNTIKVLLAKGDIGYIPIGKRKNIAQNELVRFQKEGTIRKAETVKDKIMIPIEFVEFFHESHKRKTGLFDSKQFLENTIRSDNNGNN